MGWRPSLSGMRASTTLIATRSTDTSLRPPACPRQITRSGRVSSIAWRNTPTTLPITHGSWRAASRAPATVWPSRRLAASQDGFSVSPSKGSIPVISTVGIAASL
ncbi:hypothetical protein D3C72_2041860 [compost metagenome]